MIITNNNSVQASTSDSQILSLIEKQEVVTESYDLNHLISKIKNLHEEGKKTGLLIGRTDQEPLPLSDKNFVWVSGDIKQSSQTQLNDRIHIGCDFNGDLQSLYGLFNKVVVDQSTWKFFENDPIQRFTRLLKDESDTELVFESMFVHVAFDKITEYEYDYVSLRIPEQEITEYEDRKNELLEDYKKNTSLEKQQEAYESFVQSIPEELKECYEEEHLSVDFETSIKEQKAKEKNILPPEGLYKTLARKKTVEYLKTLFHDVVLSMNTPFPYETRYNSESNCYFVAKHKKCNLK